MNCLIFQPTRIQSPTSLRDEHHTHVWRTVADQEGPRKLRKKKKKSPGQWIAGASWALQNVGPRGLDMWWCFVRGNGMYLHEQIHQSRGLFPQFTGITVFELAGPGSQCASVCVCVLLQGCLAPLLVAQHICTHTAPPDCQAFVRAWWNWRMCRVMGRYENGYEITKYQHTFPVIFFFHLLIMLAELKNLKGAIFRW